LAANPDPALTRGGCRLWPPLPDGVRNVTPQAIGTIDLETLTFSPEVITPVYLE